MTNFKSLVPRTMIPQVYPVCPRCGAGTKATLATAHADGYHRRHLCRECQHGFYTLASYEGEDYQTSPRPFKDRELTEFELAQRVKWWEEYESLYKPGKVIPREVNEPVMPRGRPPPLISRMAVALRMPPEERTQIDRFLVASFEALSKRVVAMEAAAIIKSITEDTSDGQQETGD